MLITHPNSQQVIMNKFTLSTIVTVLLSTSTLVNAGDTQVGSSLNEKYDMELSAIPATALNAILKLKPDFIAKEAEKEIKHGKHYLDIEGVDALGNEVEFDMLQKGGSWQVVEVQRDLTLEQCPKIVLDVLPQITPKRIIESDQTTGVVVYEFYTVDANGGEKKYEVKVENNKAELLDKEWQH